MDDQSLKSPRFEIDPLKARNSYEYELAEELARLRDLSDRRSLARVQFILAKLRRSGVVRFLERSL